MAHRKLIKALRAACPTITVKVRFVPIPDGHFGDCKRRKDYFLIRIHPKGTYQEQVDSLVHEFAHAEAYLEWENHHDHLDQFGIAFAKFYRVMEKTLT